MAEESPIFVKLKNLVENCPECNFSTEELENAFRNIHLFPRSLNVTNIPEEIYSNDSLKQEFERIFMSIDETAEIIYLPSFRRVRVTFQTSEHALFARLQLNDFNDSENGIRCYFAQFDADQSPLKDEIHSNNFLRLPETERLFLLSPPASPPVGWKPREESQPVLNLELKAALANLVPNSTFELLSGCENSGKPQILLTTSETTEINPYNPSLSGPIPHTKCPERK